ncbi:MAG: hypothetical protein EXR72_12025 [Myxococcales bacterium]|nr:hypothetical protein [Myxococcales bacterium]
MIRRALFFAFLFAGVLAAGSFGSARADDDKCTIALKGDNSIVKACAAGGRPAASKAMKTLVKAAKAKGVDFKCDSCHADMESYKLKDSARDDLKKLLAANK